jgi:fumarate reductase subunit C
MNGKVGARRAYIRPMQGWWRRDPFFMAYMAREATAFAVAIYSIVLAVGVLRLAQGQAAWDGWLAALRSPGSILLHVVLLVSFAVHARSWFEIMPKTMPMMHFGGSRVEASAITRTGWIATIVVSVVMFALTWWWKK